MVIENGRAMSFGCDAVKLVAENSLIAAAVFFAFQIQFEERVNNNNLGLQVMRDPNNPGNDFVNCQAGHLAAKRQVGKPLAVDFDSKGLRNGLQATREGFWL